VLFFHLLGLIMPFSGLVGDSFTVEIRLYAVFGAGLGHFPARWSDGVGREAYPSTGGRRMSGERCILLPTVEGCGD
jgi:hypothetical protein